MTNTLSLFSRYAKVLFDSGATFSFISIAFAYHANRNTKPLDCYLIVASPMGDNMIVNQVYNSCLISFGDINFYADLLPIVMHDFDVILGIDWLTTYHANIDCFSKEIVFKVPGETKFQFRDNRKNYEVLIFVLKFNKMLAK